jgi:DNA-binding IscR family transcriptional regulator
VLDILRALDLPPINDCSIDPDNCPRREICAVFPVWFEAQRELERVFGASRLSKLVRGHRALLARAAAVDRPNGTGKRLQRSHSHRPNGT